VDEKTRQAVARWRRAGANARAGGVEKHSALRTRTEVWRARFGHL